MASTTYRWFPRTLGFRLTLTYALAFILLLSITLALLYVSIGSVMDQQMDADLEEDIVEFAELLQSTGDEAVIDEINRETQAGGSASVFLLLFDANGTPVYQSDLTHWENVPIDRQAIQGVARNPDARVLKTLDVQGQEAETRAIYGALSRHRVLYLGESLEERDEIMELLPVLFAGVFMIGILIASTIVWWLTRQALQGITAVSRAAEDIRFGNLERRVSMHGQVEEVQYLADTFDGMATRIQQLIIDMRDMTDNIAHDLRSPLARIRVAAESVLQPGRDSTDFREAAKATIDECDRLIHMINISLDVSEAEAGVTRSARTSVNYSEFVEAACELFSTLAESRNISLDWRIDENCSINGIANSLQRMIANILDNAIKFCNGADSITVVLKQDQSNIVLSISDSGVGINPQALDQIFDRFYRGDSSRSVAGSGLGLSYSRAIARLHGGDITVSSKPGEGSTFLIVLPREGTLSIRRAWPDPIPTSSGQELTH